LVVRPLILAIPILCLSDRQPSLESFRGFMDTTEVIVPEPQRQRRFQVVQFPRKGVGQPRKPALLGRHVRFLKGECPGSFYAIVHKKEVLKNIPSDEGLVPKALKLATYDSIESKRLYGCSRK